MKTTIVARVNDQTLSIYSLPKLASGGVDEIEIKVEFGDGWDDTARTAVFYRDKGKVYQVVMVDDKCLIPYEVMLEPGKVYFGLMGVQGSMVRTSEVVAFTFHQGAIVSAVAVPLPDVYTQILTAYGKTAQAVAVERARIDNLLANSGTGDDAELVDVRVGEDGHVYSSAGAAVRAQIGLGLLWRSAPAYDADQCTGIGFYFAGGSENWENIPGSAGMLATFSGNTQHRLYQLFFSYDTENHVYVRHMHGTFFTDWTVLTTEQDSVNAGSYYVEKQTDGSLFLYKRGTNGYIRYRLGRSTDANINLDVWRLIDAYLCDADKTAKTAIFTQGMDVEGVVLLPDEGDHIGGVHGDEVMSEGMLFLDGHPVAFGSVQTGYAREVKLAVRSTLYHVGTSNACMTREKIVTFGGEGVHVQNAWTATEALDIQSIRASMLSVSKNCIDYYSDTVVNTYPVAAPASADSVVISEDKRIVDISYMGNITARHWAGKRGGDESGYSTLLQDYGERLKSYFNCYDGYHAKAGDILTAESHFRLDC